MAPESGRERLAAGDAPQGQRGPFLGDPRKTLRPAARESDSLPTVLPRLLPPSPRGPIYGTRQSVGTLKNMGKSHLELVAPTSHYGTAGSQPPPRRRNADVRAREYLTDAEVERLMKAAGNNRHGHR